MRVFEIKVPEDHIAFLLQLLARAPYALAKPIVESIEAQVQSQLSAGKTEE